MRNVRKWWEKVLKSNYTIKKMYGKKLMNVRGMKNKNKNNFLGVWFC